MLNLSMSPLDRGLPRQDPLSCWLTPGLGEILPPHSFAGGLLDGRIMTMDRMVWSEEEPLVAPQLEPFPSRRPGTAIERKSVRLSGPRDDLLEGPLSKELVFRIVDSDSCRLIGWFARELV